MGGLTIWHLAVLSVCGAAVLVTAGLGVYALVQLYRGRRGWLGGGR